MAGGLVAHSRAVLEHGRVLQIVWSSPAVAFAFGNRRPAGFPQGDCLATVIVKGILRHCIVGSVHLYATLSVIVDLAVGDGGLAPDYIDYRSRGRRNLRHLHLYP